MKYSKIELLQPLHISGSILDKIKYYQELIEKYSDYENLHIMEVLREGGGTKFVLYGDRKDEK